VLPRLILSGYPVFLQGFRLDENAVNGLKSIMKIMKTILLAGMAVMLFPPWLWADVHLPNSSSQSSELEVSLATLQETKSCPGCDLRNATLRGLDLEGADLRSADLSGAKINQVSFKNALFDKAKLTGTILQDVNLNNASLEGADCTESSFFKVDLKGARFSGAAFSQAVIKNVDFSEAEGKKADFSGVEMFAAKFNHAELTGSVFTDARVKESDFTSAVMQDMDLNGALFFKTDLQGLDVQRAVMGDTSLFSGKVQGASGRKITADSAKKHVTYVAVYGLIHEKERILLCQPVRKNNKIVKKWTLPGGRIKFKEDPGDTLVRKVRDEAGVVVSGKQVAGVDSKTIEVNNTEYHSIRIVYHAEVTAGKIADECSWWSAAKAQSLDLTDIADAGLHLAFDTL